MTQTDISNTIAIGLMFTATALLCGGAYADVGAPVIEDTNAPPQAFIEAASKPLQTTRRQLRPSEVVDSYRARIEEMEAQHGAYGAGIDEQLLGLATALQKAGQHEEAIEEFRRAMLINRVNEGLYSLNQIPMIEHMIESQIALSEWEDANDNQQYLYWLHARNYGENDPRMLPVINDLSRWHLQAYTEEKGDTLFEHLISATNLYELAVDIITQNFGANDLRLVDALRGLKATNYYLATYKGEPQPPVVINTSFGGGGSVDPAQRSKLDNYRMNSFSTGKNAIARIVDVYQKNPHSPPAASAKAKVELGDWYMMFNKWHSARKTYGEAYQALWDNGATNQEIEDIFGRPAALPALPMLEEDRKALTESHVTVSYDVTAFGKARNIEILRAYPDRVATRSRVRNVLKRAKFRPRFENGEPVETVGIVQRFVFE
ncbi:hypothetical protein SAMN04487965_2384 [Microbulbifer donghaiensis]|uniref:Uncharacterized protein n=1 Tax=Microbulbifer donghaiensis TaxID=494016 RepID=A0A1M5D2I4_9GAMM|nr:hypothetical protein [Microbulbifer donghaiensis]SHF61181.1 hypothetical protein SAMN04487965_2384 [Microbulbifer donghaiensis]